MRRAMPDATKPHRRGGVHRAGVPRDQWLNAYKGDFSSLRPGSTTLVHLATTTTRACATLGPPDWGAGERNGASTWWAVRLSMSFLRARARLIDGNAGVDSTVKRPCASSSTIYRRGFSFAKPCDELSRP